MTRTKALALQDARQKEFRKIFEKACYMNSSWQVWSDFIFLSAVSIQNAVDPAGPLHDEREREYMNTIRRYGEDERALLPKLLGVVVEALEENPEQDFLGGLFMGLGLNSHWHGQFFTPYHVCHMMALINMDGIEAAVERKGWVGVIDPCCGGGALLIAARNVMADKGLGYGAAWYEAQDIDRTTALMCYIQLAMLGCAGRVAVGNSLLQERDEVWILPATYFPIWQTRILFHGLFDRVEKAAASVEAASGPVELPGEELTESIPPEPPIAWKAEETGQLTLF